MTEIQCDICQDSFTLNQFRFYPCGHGFCETCLEKTRLQPTCAVCRRSKGNDEPRHVYISFVESSALEPKAAVEAGGSRVGINPPPASIQLNIQRLKGKAKQVADVQCRKGLLMVADSLEEGISDLFSELERERTTKRTLKKETRLLEAKFAEAQKSETEVVRLRRKLREADANYKSAVSSAEEALGRVQGQAAENKRLNLAVERHRRASEKKDAEIRELRATVEQKEKESRLWKHKLHALAKQAKRATQDPDDSLHIVGRPMEIETIKKQIKGL